MEVSQEAQDAEILSIESPLILIWQFTVQKIFNRILCTCILISVSPFFNL